ncbi:pectinesterase QRT1-like [Papaver somniferum]|uniref:pectinesterase QRT1-like n=1 Tax=Papaver somniferum TaxID=3469 RepID=UPI000E6F8B3F|nr:pectinesterase QRT1-like [Papaver somniferum]
MVPEILKLYRAQSTWFPENNTRRVKIYIRPGIYREKVLIPENKPYISLIGIEANHTMITWNAKASDKDGHGKEIGTFKTATVNVESDYFCAKLFRYARHKNHIYSLRFEKKNTVVAKPRAKNMQGVALKISGNKSVLYNVRFLGYRDTLYDHHGTHYFYKCFIQGAIDFVFGNARSLYEDCTINSVARRHGYGFIAASHRNSPDENTGFSFLNSRIRGGEKTSWEDHGAIRLLLESFNAAVKDQIDNNECSGRNYSLKKKYNHFREDDDPQPPTTKKLRGVAKLNFVVKLKKGEKVPLEFFQHEPAGLNTSKISAYRGKLA